MLVCRKESQKELCLLLSFYYFANSTSIANNKERQEKEYGRRKQEDC